MKKKIKHIAKIEGQGNKLYAEGIYSSFRVPFQGEAKPGQLVEIALQANQVEDLGSEDNIQALEKALLQENSVLDFTNKELKAAKQLESNEDNRIDLCSLLTFTIDGESTRDFDDAISVIKKDNQIDFYIHISDVSAFLEKNDLLDKAAKRRAQSVYLQTCTKTMLPPSLSEDKLSLIKDKDRFCLTCQVSFSKNKNKYTQKKVSFYRSLIRVDHQLTYKQVESFLEGKNKFDKKLEKALQECFSYASQKENQQKSREKKIRVSNNEITIEEYNEDKSRYLIERLMILANQSVAEYLQDNLSQALYRNHERDFQKENKVKDKLQFLDNKDHPDEFLEKIKRGAFKSAEYVSTPDLHHGLQLTPYTHFTSPIRRYADLIVHRLLLALLEERELPYQEEELQELAHHLNQRNQFSKRLERKSRQIVLTHYYKDILEKGNTLKIKITGFREGQRSGVYCQINEDLEGFLPDKIEVNPLQTEASSLSHDFCLGQELKVKIKRVDFIKGEISLSL